MESSSKTSGEEKRFSDLGKEDDEFLILRQIIRSSSCDLSVFLCLFVARLRRYTSTYDSDTDGEVGGDGREDFCSLPTLLTLLYFFSTLLRMNFATGKTNREDVGARLVKASIKTDDFVHFSMLCANISSNVLRWVISVRTVFTK